jgi:hypothetical protein
MARTSRPGSALIGALVTAVLLTAGCTTTLEGAPAPDSAPVPTEGPGSDPVAWAGRVCDAVLSFAVAATAAPDFATTGDLPAVQRAFSDYLGDVVTGTQQGRAQLAEVGLAPEPAGDEAVGRAESEMKVLEENFSGVKTAVDAVNATNPEAFMAALTQAEQTLAAITAPNPIGELGAAPRLQRAAERASQCQELSAVAASVPR